MVTALESRESNLGLLDVKAKLLHKEATRQSLLETPSVARGLQKPYSLVIVMLPTATVVEDVTGCTAKTTNASTVER